MGYGGFPGIKTREELYAQLDAAVNNISDEDLRDDEGNPSKKYLKAIIVESNTDSSQLSLPDSLQILDTADPTLKLVRLNNKSGTPTFSYLDILDKRFWTIFSLDSSQDIRHEINRLITTNNSQLDYAWFSSSSLQKIGAKFDKTSFGMKFFNYFDNRAIPVKRLSIKLWAEEASEIISALNSTDKLRKAICFSNVEVVYKSSPTTDRYVKTRLAHNGVINVAKGNSAEDLLEFINLAVAGHYKPLINRIETENTISYNYTNSVAIEGSPIWIKLKEPDIADFSKFIKQLISGTNPFRLTGLSRKIGDEDHYLLDLLDLHTSDRFSLEVFTDEMLLALPSKTCGNCVTRLFTLIQNHLDPHARIYGDNGEII